MDRAQQIAQMHAEYIRLTGFKISLAGREWCWFEWLKRDLGLPELRMLVAEKKRRIRAGELTAASLAFRNLIGNVDFAEEDIAELRIRGRVPKVDPERASVLRQTGRESEAARSVEPRAAGEIAARVTSDPVAAAAALAELQRLKNNL